ncbi:MAG: ATP-dependent DNA helicase DinG [SAR86 cluster bacterium]|uniref:ATP-dependent DNA helicase DinG n=1 Tax=SAR86 cluster bacterium TaxID=2030880 RepID=A0A2A5C6S3_9GAMM|nr:ATP-dependent DNA helicase DinG [Gammaproteobacteria bacterium AH-315-E17]PCJ39507.1 MAG: ATP-dependent DNA helicase DinG [SAR86 cluster bacterium]
MISDQVKQDIQSYYSQFLQNRNLKPRYGQKLMIAEIAKTLSAVELDEEGKRCSDSPPLCVVEAGTGTGKTIAYLVAVLPLAKALGKQVVIATATVALQEQIMFKDIPELQANTDMEFSCLLAKGRGRYLCLSKLENLLRVNSSQEAMQDLYGLELDDPSQLDKQVYQEMMKALDEKRWQGDRDDWIETLDNQQWRAVSVEHGQCSGSRCSNFNSCYFFKSRQLLQQSDCIIANQDLVLADLSLGGGAILPHPSEVIYVFDEAHHLAAKGLSHFSHFVQLRSSLNWLDQSKKLFIRLQQQAGSELKALFEKADAAALEARHKLNEAFLLLDQYHTEQMQSSLKQSQHTFDRGVVDPELRETCGILYLCFSQLGQALDKILSRVRQCMENQGGEIDSALAESWYPGLGSIQARCEASLMLWFNYANQDESEGIPQARWLTFSKTQEELEISLSCSPILAAEALTEKLWNECFAAVLTSATLSALNSFDFLIMRTGLPEGSRFCRIGSPFDFAEAGVLRIPEKGFDAGDSSAHTEAIIKCLPEMLDEDKGALVLFSSRRQMTDVLEGLEEDFKDDILSQDDYPKQQLITLHKANVDKGKRSIIFGLASMSEGIDLPAAYCTHVVIAKLPFSVPDDPIDVTLGQWMKDQGKNPFIEISIPETAMKLVQASGRLLRSESDSGKISILDERLLNRRYGASILDALPPYRREIFSA